MRPSTFAYFAGVGLKTILLRRKDPILGTVIVTDRCNLHCRHCSVNNLTSVIHPYEQICAEMRRLLDMSIRIPLSRGDPRLLLEALSTYLRYV